MIWLIGIGGAIGACTRYLLSAFIGKRIQRQKVFPISTWIINITGSFLLGILANLHMTNQITNGFWYFAGVGFCGAYTTFSTFGYETIKLLSADNWKSAVMYVLSSILFGLLFATAGYIL